ncbi:Hypothetical predicted protein, partial [Mytilus galloprovincialis]
IVAGRSKYIYPTPAKPQCENKQEEITVDILSEDLYINESEDSDEEVIYIKTTGPPRFHTNSYGYLVEKKETPAITDSYTIYEGCTQQINLCEEELNKQLTVKEIHNIYII